MGLPATNWHGPLAQEAPLLWDTRSFPKLCFFLLPALRWRRVGASLRRAPQCLNESLSQMVPPYGQ